MSSRPQPRPSWTKKVSTAKWTAGVGILTGRIKTSNELSQGELRELREYLRGPYFDGMPQEAAVTIIDVDLGWRIEK